MSFLAFSRWLRLQRQRHDRVGDIARDVLRDMRDGCMYARTPNGVRRHMLARHHPDAGAVVALDAAIQEWEDAP